MLIAFFRLAGFPPYTPFVRVSLVAIWWGMILLCIVLAATDHKDFADRLAFVLVTSLLGTAVMQLKDDEAARQRGIDKLNAISAAATVRKGLLAGRMANMLRPLFDNLIDSTEAAVQVATDANEAADHSICRFDSVLTWGE